MLSCLHYMSKFAWKQSNYWTATRDGEGDANRDGAGDATPNYNGFRVFVLGDQGMGKSAYVRSVLNTGSGVTAEGRHDIPGFIEFFVKGLAVNEQLYDVSLVDMPASVISLPAPPQRILELIQASHAFILLFDTGNIDSFKSLDKYYHVLLDNSGGGRVKPFVVVGTHGDMQSTRQVSPEDAITWASKRRASYYETYSINVPTSAAALRSLMVTLGKQYDLMMVD